MARNINFQKVIVRYFPLYNSKAFEFIMQLSPTGMNPTIHPHPQCRYLSNTLPSQIRNRGLANWNGSPGWRRGLGNGLGSHVLACRSCHWPVWKQADRVMIWMRKVKENICIFYTRSIYWVNDQLISVACRKWCAIK